MLTLQERQNLLRAVRASTSMGASNALVTESDAALLDEWEVSGGKLQPKEGAAPNGLRIGTASETISAAGDDSTGDFDDGETGSNIAHNGTAWANSYVTGSSPFNDGNYNSDANTPYVVLASNEGIYPGWKAFDGDETTTFWEVATGTFPQNIVIDLGSGNGKRFAQYRIKSSSTSNANPGAWTVHGSNDGAAYTLLDTRTGQSLGTGWSGLFNISSPDTYRYYKFTATGGASYSWCQLREIDFRESTLATTLNTITTDNLVESGSKNFAPASLVVKDQADSTIAGSTFNIAYEVNGGGMSSLMNQAAFKALSPALFESCTSLLLKLQPVGSQQLKSVSIDTASTDILLGYDGTFRVSVSGVEIVSTNASGKIVGSSLTLEGNVDTDDGATVALTTSINDARADTSDGTVDYTLPDLTAAGAVDGQRIRIADGADNAGSNTVTIAPAVTLSSLDVNTILHQSGNTIRYTFNGTPDLSNVKVGNYLAASSSTNASNDGTFVITAVSDGSDYIEVTNSGRSDNTDDEASDSPSVCNVEQTVEQDAGAGTANRHELDSNGESVVLIANVAKMRWEIE